LGGLFHGYFFIKTTDFAWENVPRPVAGISAAIHLAADANANRSQARAPKIRPGLWTNHLSTLNLVGG